MAFVGLTLDYVQTPAGKNELDCVWSDDDGLEYAESIIPSLKF